MSSQLDLIRLTLVELIDDMNGDNPDNVDSQAAASNICSMVMELKQDEMDMATSLLFNPDKGILYFLRKSLDKSVHGGAKAIFLEFTAEFITRLPISIAPYIVDIKRTCLALFLNDSLARVKKSSLLPIKFLLTSCSKMIDPEALDISGLFDKLYDAYGTQQSKLASTVKAEVLEVLGIIARHFPKVAEKRHAMLLRWCLTTIQEQLRPGSKQELSLVAGALIGLDNSLYSFADKVNTDVPTILQLVKTLVNVPEDLSRFATPIAALDLFAHHIHLFRSRLIDIYEWMYQRITGYCEHSHGGMSKCGYNSLDVFLQEMASVLTVSEITEREYNCFLFFTANFTQIISTEVVASAAQYKAMSVAIRGYGYFAAPCKHIAPDQLKNLVAQLLRKSSFLVSSNTNEGIDGSSSHLAAFIAAYTNVAQVYDEIPQMLMTALNQIANVAVVNFTKMSTYARIDCTISIERLLVMLFHKGEGILRGFFDKFSYKLLVFTSADIAKPSTSTPFKGERVTAAEEANWHSYAVYLFLWRNLFKPASLSQELDKTPVDISSEEVERFLAILYGSTMESFKRLVALLNLTVSDSDMDLDEEIAPGVKAIDVEQIGQSLVGPVSGDVAKMQANCAKDFIIFQNLTEFWQIFLVEIRPDLFARWTFVIGNTLIELSSKHPLVSGFYKMFATCLQVCQTISLFKQSSKPTARVKVENEFVDAQRAAALFKKYIREVLARLEQYKDDLLASCLHLVLSSPSALTDSSSIIPPIQLALKLGLGYFPLATVGLDAVEHWIDILDRDHDLWLSQVLPCLNEYLLVEVSGGGEDMSDVVATKTKQRAQTRQSQSYKAVARTASMLTTSDQVQSLRDFQLRILRLLGRQAQHNKLILSQQAVGDGAKKEPSDLLAWDPEIRVKLKIPFQEMKMELQFDEMLPRIVDLAENSLHRQIKVASCELLHSLMMLMIGSSAFRARDVQDPKKSPFHRIFLKVFPALLRLAVDVDQVPRSLYRPLLSQLIHWLTNNAQYENPETIALLNACMDAACDTLGPLRDYGAECLGEFVKWSVKQTSSSSSSGSVNVKSLLKRIYNLASHSNPAKRLGASLIVNRIYRVFREEASLVNQFTMELLYWMLFSLRLAEGDHVGLGTRQQTCVAIGHLQRIVQVKATMFLKDSRDRRRVPGLSDVTVAGLIDWLLKETSRPEVEYARMCRVLFDAFVKLLPGSPTPGSWIGEKISQDPRFIASVYDGANFTTETFAQPVAYQKWCSQLASTLANYIWLLNHPGNSDALTTQMKSASILTICAKFLEKCLLFSRSLDQNRMSTPLTPLERQQIMDQNFMTTRRVISFVSLIASRGLERGNGDLVAQLQSYGLIGQKFFTVYAQCLLNPDSIGNEELLKGGEEAKALRSDLEMGLKVLRRLPADVGRSFGEALMATISSGDLIPLAVSPDTKGQDPIKCKAVIDGLELVQECGLLGSMFEESSRKTSRYIASLFDTFMTMQDTKDPLWINYCSALLRLSLGETECQERLWRYLLDPNNFEPAKMTYLKYADDINRHLALHFMELTPTLSRSARESQLILTIWNDFLDYMFSHPEQAIERNTFLDMLTKDYSALESIVNSLEKDQISMIIAMWKRIVALSPRVLRTSKSEAFIEYFFKVYQSFFERDNVKKEYLTLPIMSEAIPILPIFLSYPGVRTAEFESVFNRAVLNLMPMSSSEYERGSSRFKDYISALDLLLKALVASSSISLFKTLMGVAIRESNHPHMEQMQQFIASFALKLSLSKFLEVTGYCFGEFLKRTHSDEHRRNIVHQILLPILKIVPPLNVSEFYALNIAQIMGMVKQDQPRLTDVDIRRDFIERACCYDLVHVLYMRLPSELVNAKGSKIVDAFTGNNTVTGKELTVDVFRTANAAKFKQDNNPMTPEAAALREDFKRAAYNALAAAILCTQRKEDFYRQFLFRDNEAKKEFVWENIVDLKAHYHFEQVLSGRLVRTRLSDLRSKSLNPNKTYNSKHQYMSSQYLRDSSLSQSVGVLDEDNVYNDSDGSTSKQNEDFLLESDALSQSSELKTLSDGKDDEKPEDEHILELDAINSNPCMKMILLIIKELHASITPPPKEMTKEDGSMPSWMKDIHRKLVNPNTPLNIRLFLAKIIINLPEAFEMYGGSWIRPLMKLAMEGESYGEAMNYFVQDLCVLAVVWGESVKLANSYEDRVLLLNFLSYLMKNCYHEQRQYLLNNIDLIKGTFENWSKIAIVPTTIIYNNFKSIKDEKKNITGVQLLGIVLTHDNPPFYKGPEIDLGTLRESDYYEALVRNMGSSLKVLYTSAAEVCGLVLAYMKKHDSLESYFQDLVTKKLSELLTAMTGPGPRSKSGKSVAFINCLHKVQLNFPEITDAFGPRLLFLFPQLLGEERTLALEIFAGRAAFLPDLFQSLQGLNFLGCLKHRDEATQFASLSIIYGLWDSLKADQILYFLDTIILEFSSHSSIECRKLYYSILMVLFDKQTDTPAVSSVLRTQLLRGLGDPSESIRHTVVEFWYGKNRLPSSTFERLGEIVRNMYDTQAEDKFLNYAIYMLLDRTKTSPDYTEPIFQEPLPNARFSDNYANIDTSWKHTVAMTPLFVNTQQSQSQMLRNESSLGDDELRATQSTFEFSMTLDGGAAGIRFQLGGSGNSGSTLMFRNRSSQDTGASLSSQALLSDVNQKYRRLQMRRVQVSEAEQSQRFKRAYETKVQSKMHAAIDREIARAKSVSMIRRYRDGDLPDIQIAYSDIIRPLQSLAELDVEICRLLFSRLVTGLIGQVDSHMEEEEEAISYKEGLIANFGHILQRSTILYTPFIGSILRICHDYGHANIPAQLIARVSIRSSNQHLGIILIEKQIQEYEPKERSAKRQKTSGAGTHDPKRGNWIELARVYKSIDDKDIFKSIYENKVATTEFTREAIEAEVVGDYDRAVKVYFDGITKHFANEIQVDDAEQSIWAHGRLECLEHLGDWDYLEANMMSDLDNDPQELWTEDYQDPYLHYFLTSYIKLVEGKREEEMLEMWTPEQPNPLFQFLDEAMNNPSHRQILTTQYQPELALAAVMRKDFKQASYYVRRSYDRFLSVWSNLHPLSEKPRLHELANLQRIVEMEEFLTGVDEVLRTSKANPLEPLLSKWGRRFPGKSTDTMVTWNNVLDDRKLMVQRLEDHIPYSRKQEMLVTNHRIQSFMNMSAAAREQGNFYVAKTCISSMQQLQAPSYDIYYSQLKLDLAKAQLEMDRSVKADILVDSLSKFDRYVEDDQSLDTSQIVGLNVLASKAYRLLRDLIVDDSRVHSSVKSSDWARDILRGKANTANLTQELQQRGFECLRAAAAVQSEDDMSKKLRLTTATYCDKILRHYENEEDEVKKGSSNMSAKDLAVYANLVIKNTLLSIRDEDLGATELFPRLLQIIEIYPSSQKTFTELVSDFPGSWTFVRWIQQMVAVLDKPIGACLMPVLKSIALQYPNALYYPLTISAENYSFEQSTSGEKRKSDVALLKKAVQSPLKEDFIFELRRLTNPEHLLKDWLEQTVALFQHKTRNAEQIMALYQDLHRLILDVGNPRLGSIAKAFAAKHGSRLESLCGKTGQKLTTISNRDFNANILKYSRNEILGKEAPKKQSDADLLKAYSPWLHSFQASDHDGEIDIPGQFTGLRPPNGQQTATVVRFDQRVLVMSSIRKPKRICILGSDEKEHLFLVKGGEDLRLDQRIQQLFSLMNDIMRKDPQCSQQNISVGTYKVIPMSGSLGILEWVDNTKPLRHCIEGEIKPKEIWRKTQEQYNKFVASFKGDMMGYHNLFIHGTREKVIRHMESLYSQFRDGYLRQSIARLAASPEAFLMLRSEFARSLAAINVCSYVLGIGDRHLENFLLDMSNGCLIPIDFGHAFGSATEVLPVPELAPFRLTRQLESFLNPLGTKGLLEHPMVCIMKALQNKKDVILNTMDVFVKEPLLDWRKFAINQAREQKKRGADMESFEIDEDGTAPPAWYLQQKMGIARRKLEGYNPAYLTVEELNMGHANKPFLAAISKIAMGDKQHSVRARHGEVCGSVQGQVECLIDMATDLDILGRAWVGWMSWV